MSATLTYALQAGTRKRALGRALKISDDYEVVPGVCCYTSWPHQGNMSVVARTADGVYVAAGDATIPTQDNHDRWPQASV